MFWRFIVPLCSGSSIILMDSLNLKIRALQLLEMLGTTCINTQHRIPEYWNPQQCHCENVRFNILIMLNVSFIMLYVTKLICFIWYYKAFSLSVKVKSTQQCVGAFQWNLLSLLSRWLKWSQVDAAAFGRKKCIDYVRMLRGFWHIRIVGNGRGVDHVEN